MSDRYNQLTLLDLVETKVEREMYPNFAVGDEVEYQIYTDDSQDKTRKGKIIQILDKDWFKVDCLNGYQLFCSPLALKKVRVHQALEPDFEAAAQEHKSPSIHYEIKEIKGRFYKYARWREGDRHKSKYIGRALANS